MLLGIGPGVQSLQDYTMLTEARGIKVTQNQGDTLDTFKCVVTDLTSSMTIAAEDDIVWMNEHDTNGFPNVNLLQNPNFSFPYENGNTVPFDWNGVNTSATGVTSALSWNNTGSTGYPAGVNEAMSITFNNVANGLTVGVYQQVALPRDQNQNLISALGYVFSVYIGNPTALSGVGAASLKVSWLDYNQSLISSVSSTYTVNHNNGWVRYATGNNLGSPYNTQMGTVVSQPLVPPSNAWYVQCQVSWQTTSTTNSGQVLLAAAQLERCIFSNYRTTDLPIGNFYNSQMGTTATAWTPQVADQWYEDYTPAGASFSLVSSPALYKTGQQISVTNIPVSGTTVAIAQEIMHHPAYNYTLTATYKVTQAFTGGLHLRLGASIYDVVGTTTTTTSTKSNATSIATNASLVTASGSSGQGVTTQLSVARHAQLPKLGSSGGSGGGSGSGSTTTVTTTTTYNNAFPAIDSSPIGTSSAWQSIQLTYGPDTTRTSSIKPGIGSHAHIYFGIVNAASTTTNAGTIVIGSITITATPSSHAASYTRCIYMGTYPTAYAGQGLVIGPSQSNFNWYYSPGANYDNADKQYYRQQRYFGGYVRNIVYDYSQGAERSIEVDGVEYGILLNEAPVNSLIHKQADNLAIKQALDYAKNQGFLDGLDYTTYVQNIVTVDAMLFNWTTARDVVSKIADHSVAAFWVDPYKQLHYTPQLATTAPFGISDQPDMRTTYPASSVKIQNDSTGSMTTPVIAGSTQLSAPQTIYRDGFNTTTTAALSGAVTSIPVTAINYQLYTGDLVYVSDGTNNATFTLSANTGLNATSLSVNSLTLSATIATAATVTATAYSVNSSQPIAQIDQCSVGGTGKTIGISNVNSYSQGYDTLMDLQAGVLFFQNAPANGTNNVAIVYRYTAPVLVRLHAPSYSTKTGKIRRSIHTYISETTISSQQTAIDRANAELTVNGKPKKVGEAVLYSPNVPFDASLMPGQAIAVTFSKGGLNGVLYQIQQIDTEAMGNNVFKRTLKLGYYRPDFIVYMAIAKRKQDYTDLYSPGTVLQDVLSSDDAWAVSDQFTFVVSNIGKWGTNAGAGVWGDGVNGALVWG